jgi:hypothetical protein
MPNGFLTATRPLLLVDDIASEAMALDPLCPSLRVETVRAAGVVLSGEILAPTRVAAVAHRGVPRPLGCCQSLH